MSKFSENLKGRIKRPRPHDEMIQTTHNQEENKGDVNVGSSKEGDLKDRQPSQEKKKRKPGRPKRLNVKPMTINMDEELFERFDHEVWKNRGNKSEIIRQLVEMWLKEKNE